MSRPKELDPETDTRLSELAVHLGNLYSDLLAIGGLDSEAQDAFRACGMLTEIRKGIPEI